MSKLTDSFRAARVFNPHNFYAGNPYITYLSQRGRGHNFSGWRVHKEGQDLGTHWTDHGSRSFSTFPHRGKPAEARASALAEAQAWASERFNVTEWVRDPYGSYGPADYVPARVAELKRLATAHSEP